MLKKYNVTSFADQVAGLSFVFGEDKPMMQMQLPVTEPLTNLSPEEIEAKAKKEAEELLYYSAITP